MRRNFILTRVVSFKSTQKHWTFGKWMIALALFYFSKLFQPCCEAVTNISLLKISSPTRFEGKFYFDRRVSFFQITQKTLRPKMSGFLFFMFSNRCSLETYQQNNTICVLQIWVKIKLITSILRALGRELSSFENTQRITDPSEASKQFFFL